MKAGNSKAKRAAEAMTGCNGSDASDGKNRYAYARAPAHDPSIEADVRSVRRDLDVSIPGGRIDPQSVSANNNNTRNSWVLKTAPPFRGAAAPQESPAKQRKREVDTGCLGWTVDGSPASTTHARIAVIGEILALGYLRLLGRNTRGKAGKNGDSWLDISLEESGHATPVEHGGQRG